MKKWELPQVRIDQFAANECVSACQYHPVHPVDESLDYAVDFVDGNDNLDFEEAADGIYKKSAYEAITGGMLPNAFTNYSFNPNGYWFRKKALYKKLKDSYPSSGASFSDKNSFEYVGTYDIYVSPKGVSFWWYAPGTADGDTPSDQKNYS